MRTLFQDLRFALRTLAKNMTLTLVMVVSLAIGIGANRRFFSVVDALTAASTCLTRKNRTG